jgi:hypothetical protein
VVDFDPQEYSFVELVVVEEFDFLGFYIRIP